MLPLVSPLLFVPLVPALLLPLVPPGESPPLLPALPPPDMPGTDSGATVAVLEDFFELVVDELLESLLGEGAPFIGSSPVACKEPMIVLFVPIATVSSVPAVEV